MNNFKITCDTIDLSYFSELTSFDELKFYVNPLVLLLPGNQLIILQPYSTFVLSEENFIFHKGSQPAQTANKLNDIITTGAVAGGIFGFTFGAYIGYPLVVEWAYPMLRNWYERVVYGVPSEISASFQSGTKIKPREAHKARKPSDDSSSKSSSSRQDSKRPDSREASDIENQFPLTGLGLPHGSFAQQSLMLARPNSAEASLNEAATRLLGEDRFERQSFVTLGGSSVYSWNLSEDEGSEDEVEARLETSIQQYLADLDLETATLRSLEDIKTNDVNSKQSSSARSHRSDL